MRYRVNKASNCQNVHLSEFQVNMRRVVEIQNYYVIHCLSWKLENCKFDIKILSYGGFQLLIFQFNELSIHYVKFVQYYHHFRIPTTKIVCTTNLID